MENILFGAGMTSLRRLMLIAGMNGGAENEYTVTGNPVSFTTNVSKPLRQMLIQFTPVQSGSGDPSPENVRPISGWTGVTISHSGADTSDPTTIPVVFPALGKNLIDDSKRYVPNATSVYIGSTSSDYEIYLKAGKYTISCDFNNQTYGMYYRMDGSSAKQIWASGSGTTSKTFELTEDGMYNFYAFRNAQSGGVDSDDIKTVMLQSGETASAYEPYTNTAYGGELDLVTGVLTVDMGIADLGTKSVSYNSTYGYFEIGISGMASGTKNSICDKYANSKATSVSNVQDKQYYTSGTNLRIKDSAYTDASAFRTYLSGTQFVYELATPLTFQLDPVTIQTLVGDNVVFTDTNGTNTIKYLKKG